MRSSLSKSNCRKAKKKKKEDLAMDWVARSQIRWAKDIAAASCHRNDCLIESSMAILLSFLAAFFILLCTVIAFFKSVQLLLFLSFSYSHIQSKQKKKKHERQPLLYSIISLYSKFLGRKSYAQRK